MTTRRNADGELVLLEDQDRALWDRAQIDEGLALRRGGAANGARRAVRDSSRRSRRLHARAPTRGRHRLASDRGALRAAARARAERGRRAQSRGCGRDGRRRRAGTVAASTRSPRAASCVSITCCTPRARICFGASDARRGGARVSRWRSSSRRSSPSAVFSQRRLSELRLRDSCPAPAGS